jgi:hypothetical protein
MAKLLRSPAAAAFLLAVLSRVAAFACPVCHTANGGQVRAQLFTAGFGARLLAVCSPFPVFLLIVVLIYRFFPE